MSREVDKYVIVKGTRCFPIDMLRYDCLVPSVESDSARIYGTFKFRGGNKKPVTIELFRRAEKNWAPTEGRWKSFGWKVVSCSNMQRRY